MYKEVVGEVDSMTGESDGTTGTASEEAKTSSVDAEAATGIVRGKEVVLASMDDGDGV